MTSRDPRLMVCTLLHIYVMPILGTASLGLAGELGR